MLSSRREIPSASFQLHAVHCARNITLCTRCDEPIPRAEFEEHMETVHRQLECDTGCGARMEVGKMEDHKVSKGPSEGRNHGEGPYKGLLLVESCYYYKDTLLNRH